MNSIRAARRIHSVDRNLIEICCGNQRGTSVNKFQFVRHVAAMRHRNHDGQENQWQDAEDQSSELFFIAQLFQDHFKAGLFKMLLVS
jgi:hypothetical protein